MSENKSSKWLYDELVSNGYNVGKDFNEFNSLMTSNEESRKWAFDTAQGLGYNVGKDFDEFNALINPVVEPVQKASEYVRNPYTAKPSDYSQKTEAQKAFEERGDFEPIGQGTVKLNDREVPVVVGAEGEMRVPSPVALDKEEEVFRHGFPSEAEQRELQHKAQSEITGQVGQLKNKIGEKLLEKERETQRSFPMPAGGVAGGMLGMSQADMVSQSDKETAQLRAAYNLVNDTQAHIDKVRRGGSGFFSSLGRSMAEKAGDPRTWDFGLTDMKDSTALLGVVDKAEKGEKLTDAEQMLLDASVNNALIQAYFNANEMSKGEMAGETTVDMIPFMAQILVNPLSGVGRAAASKASKAVARYINKNIIQKGALATMVKKVLPRAAAFAVGVGGDLVGGTGMAVTTNAMRTAADANKRQLNGDSAGKAWKDAILGQGIEFASENTGRFFEPVFGGIGKALGKGAGWTLGKLGAGKVVNLAEDIAKKANSPLLKEFFDNTQWHGFFGEYGEEIAGGLMNAAMVGDKTAEEVFSKENLFDTAVGLSVASVLFPAVSTVNYGVTKYNERAAALSAETEAKKVFGERWQAFKDAITGAQNNDELGKAIEQVYQSEGVKVSPKEEVKALYDYATKYYAYNALKNINPTGVRYLDDDYKALDEAYISGQALQGEEKQNALLEANRQLGELERLTGMSADELGVINDDECLARAEEADASGEFELAEAWRNYAKAGVTMAGVSQSYNDAIAQQSAVSDAEVDAISNKEGAVVSATLRGGEKVNIVGGNIAFNDDGLINDELSDKQITIIENGTKRVVGITSIASVDATVSADEEKVNRRTAIEESVRRQQRIDLGEEHVFTPGEKFASLKGEEVEFISDNGDGTAMVLVNGKENAVDKQALNDMFVASRQMAYNAEKTQQPAEVPTNEVASEEVAPATALERVPKDENGEPIYEQVDSDTAWDAIVEQTEGDVEMAQAVADGMVADKEAALKKLEKEKAKGAVTIAEKIAAEKERKAKIEAAKQELAKWKEIAGVAANRKAEEVAPVEETQPVNEMQPAEVESTEEVSVPESGNADLESELGKDSQVVSQVEEGTLQPIVAPEEVTDFETADEFVAGLLGGIKITPDSFRKETGLGIDEQRKLVGVIAGEDKGCVSVERASEIIAENYGEELAARGFHGDQQEIRDMLIDILSSGNPRSYVKQSKERRAAQWVEQATAEADAWAQSYGFSSYDDMLAYEEQLLPSIKERFKDFDEQTYWAILAENYNYDTTRESERVGNGSEVLQGERSVPSPRTENIGERNEGAEVRYDVQGSDKTADAQEQEVGAPTLLDVVRVLYSKGKEVASKLFSMKFFDVAKTPKFMQELGLRGDKFTIRYGVISRHFGKDKEHTFSEEIWEQIPKALREPFAITRYYEDENKEKQKGYRLYTTLQLTNGAYVVVSAEVKSSGRNIEVNAINTIFGRNSLSEMHDEVIYISEKITPEQQSLLNGNNPHQYTAERESLSVVPEQSSLLKRPNFAQYPTEQELSEGKDTAISETTNEIEEKNVEWRDMSAQERMDVAAKSPLTVEEINNSSVDAVNKANAVAFVNGTNNFITQLSYLKVYEDVRNRPSNSPSDNGGEDNTQLAETNDRGSADGRAGGENGDDSLQDGAERSGEDRSVADGAESSTREPDSVSGETRNSGVRGEESSMDGVSADSGNSRGGGKSRSNGGDGRRRGREKSGGDIAVDADAELSAAIEQFKETLAEFSRAGRDTLNLNIAGLNSKQLEVLPKLIADGTKIGYILVKKGVRQITAWAKSIKSYIGEPLTNAGLSDVEVDAFIKELWNSNFPIGEEVHSIAEWASIIGMEETKKAVKSTLADKKIAQDAAESINVKVADAENIAETLPFLLPQQQEDVLKAETQFFDESHNDREHAFGKGYMFTNGTGTGKTYTGLGIVKRFIKQGKGRILIVTPSQQKVTDWISDAKNLNINLRSLEDFATQSGTTATQTAGDGAVITTYANFRENAALLEDVFDLVVYDESHRLLENKAGTETRGARQHYMVTNRDEDAAFMRLREINPIYKKISEAQEKFISIYEKEIENKSQKNIPRLHTLLSEDYKTNFPKLYKAKEAYNKAEQAWGKEELKLKEQAKKDASVTKVVFLSATPFNTRDNLDYAERYIFMYPEENKETIGSYKHQSPRTRFYLDHFGGAYKFRYGRLESAAQNADVISRQEVAFSDYLQNTLNTMSGRVIDSEFDYSRDFPTVSLEMGERINSAIGSISEVEELRPLWSARNKVWGNYNYSSALFETMKVSAMVPRLKEHLKKGRKIVIFHRRTESKEPIVPPFSLMMGVAQRELKETQNEEERKKLASAIRKFKKDYADLFEWEQTLNYAMPREQLAEAFGKENILFFSGKESAKVKNEAVKQFNDDNSGKNIIVIQEASGKEGISLHDRTGKHQRVVITLALPQSPITALQIEGRIYRIGNKSNAIFEYPILGLNSEMVLFGQNFNNSVSTTENLALGSKARNLRDSFARGIEMRSGDISVDEQGVGGKADDAGTVTENDPFDNSVLDYYTNQKITAKRDNREGVDYYPTPEPLGFMMNMWGRVKDGDEILEPSAGHGAIARYAPIENRMTAVEPSQSLFARLQIKAGGAAGRSFVNDIFENYNIVNKHDVILMNPPFGVQGKLAAEHVAKAYKHLNEGGRIVAIVPEGKAQDRIGKWLDEQKDAVVVGEVLLPDVTFVQAGTSIRCRVLVIDKISNEAKRNNAATQKVTHDLSYVESVEEFFETLRGINMPDRTIDTQLIMEKKARRYASDLRSIKGVKEVYVNPDSIVVRTKGWRSFQIVWGNMTGNALRRSLAQQYSNFAKKVPYADETSQEVMMESQEIICKLANMTEGEMERFIANPMQEDDTLYRSSEEIEADHPNWLEGTTTESGKHSTQVEGTRKTYGKVGTWIEENLGKDVSILDASSGMRYGTADLRERGFNIEDVEPYQSEERKSNNPATYSSYDDINKKYDFIISNAVLNVIPDDWRTDVLHNMADKLKDGGRMFINTRKAGEEKFIKDKIEHDSPQEVLVKRNGKIASYQRFFTPQELKEWVESELGAGYTVAVANERNSGTKGLAAVVVTKHTNEYSRDGVGVYTDDALTMENDPVSKALGQSRMTSKQRREFAERERQRMVARVENLAKKLNLDNVEIVTDASTLEGKKRTAKGFYSKSTGKITIVIPNHSSVADAEQTLLHEAVAHYGLRQLFGEQFDTFLDNVYNSADEAIRREIADLAAKNGWDSRTATEEYLATLAENTNFENAKRLGWWSKIKKLFLDMLHKIGFEGFDHVVLTDNELRYILWRSYENLREPGKYRSILGEVTDIAKQYELKVGNYAENVVKGANVAEESDAEYSRVVNVADLFNARHKGAAPVVVIRSDDSIEEQLAEMGFSQEEIDDIIEIYKKGSGAFYDVERNVVVLLNTNLGKKQLKTVLWHEAVHKVIRDMGITDEQLNYFFELQSDDVKSAIKENLKNAGYEESEFAEEYLAYYIQDMYWNGLMNNSDYDVLSRLNDNATDNNRKQIEFVQPIINSIINGTFGFYKAGNETGRGRDGERGNSPRSTNFGGENRAINGILLHNSASGANAEGKTGVADDDVLFRMDDAQSAIENYNRRVLESSYQAREALQDSMLSLKEAQEAVVNETGKAMRDDEDAYMAENALSSVNTAEAAEYKRSFYQPLVDEVAAVAKKMGYEATYDYLMAKHGIERNREMSVKEALKVNGVVDKAKYESWRSERNNTIAEAKKMGLSWEETQRKLDALAKSFGATIRDYSGLSALYGNDFAVKAYGAVKDFESKVDTKALIECVKAASKATLMKLYNSSIIDEETFALVSGMYEYYVPLRGFAEKTTDEVYAYLTQEARGMGSVMKVTHGRNSKAENPIAFIGQMAEQAIAQGNRNRMKLRFLNFVLARPTSLFTVTKHVYLHFKDGEWQVETPKGMIDKLPQDATPDAIANAVLAWEKEMNENVKNSPKSYRKVDASAGIPYKMPNKENLSEHQVFVKRAGKTFVITVNGSPRVAQALNGLTNPNIETGVKMLDAVGNGISKLNRFLSTVYTTRNINFVASNFMRDMVYTNSMVWIKESPKYAMRFNKNVLVALKEMNRLFSKLEKGTLDMNDPEEKLFAEFVRNGGETGYTQLKDIEAQKKELKKMLAKADRKGLSGFKSDPLGKGKDGIEALDAWLDHVNRSIENISRFAAYKTSREMGRSVAKSIWDAKEISVNFNKKGAGAKFLDANGQTRWGSIAAAVAGGGRGLYVFWNAGIQGIDNIAKAAKNNPAKAATVAATLFTTGILLPILHSVFNGDDEDEYMMLPEYIRRNNICIKIPGLNQFATIPLPIEYRAIYGAGEYISNMISGKEEWDALKAASLITQLLPIDMLEGGAITEGDFLTPLMPSSVAPFWQAYIKNKSWTGLPVWRDSDFDREYLPQHRRVYKGTSPLLVAFTKKLNQLSGGNDEEKGWLDVNPAKLEHALEGYLGGYATQIRQLTNLAAGVKYAWNSAMGDETDENYKFDTKDLPVLSRWFRQIDPERGGAGMTSQFHEYRKASENTKSLLRLYSKKSVDPRVTDEERQFSIERLNEIQNGEDFKVMQVYEQYRKAYEGLNKRAKEDDTKENRKAVYDLMKEVNREMKKALSE